MVSDKPISVGDLVVVVRACCAANPALGFVGRVFELRPTHSYSEGSCSCPRIYEPQAKIIDHPNPRGGCLPLSWLKRLDPDALKDDAPSREELTA